MSSSKKQLEEVQGHVEGLMMKAFADGLVQGYNLAHKTLAEDFVIPMLEAESEETFAEKAQKMCQVIIHEAENAVKMEAKKVAKEEDK